MPRLVEAPPPGIARGATPYAFPNRWWDCNNMRWRGNVLQPVGGNIVLPGATATAPPRDILTWHDNTNQRWAAYGTVDHLYAYSFDFMAVYDITPVGVGPLEMPGSLNGYGLASYGSGLYGMPRSLSGAPPPGIVGKLGDWWSMDTFGELLLVCPSQDGRLFVWDPNTPATKAVLIPEAPTGNRGVIVTDQRHVVLYGAGGDVRNVAWSDQESLHVWTPGVANLAGSLRLQTQAVCMTAIKCPQGILILTTNDAHLMTYAGPPYAYGITQVGSGCGPLSHRCVVSTGALVFWPSWQNFWAFSGNVSSLQSEVKDHFFATINMSLGGMAFGANNAQFSEVWWDYPDGGSSECNRYIAYNYGAQPPIWFIGRRARTAADHQSTLNYPVLGGIAPSGTNGALYQHEIGFLDHDQPRAPAGDVFIESSAIFNNEGNDRIWFRQVIYDGWTDPVDPAFGIKFLSREQPFALAAEFATPLYTDIHDGLMDVRVSGRSLRMRIEATRDVWFEIGRTRIDVVQGGTR